MTNVKLRAKVQRLIGGDFRLGDLSDLFLFARDHCDGRESVIEIGDFVAHHAERDKGVLTRGMRDWFTTIQFHTPFIGKIFDPNRMPKVTRDYLKIAVNRLDGKTIQDKAGLRKATAYQMSQDIADRLIKNQDETWALPPLNSREASLFELLRRALVVLPPFTDKRLVEDFIATLKSNALITKEELLTHRTFLEQIVKLFAVSLMHNCVIKIPSASTTKLKAGIESNATDKISVTGIVKGAASDLPLIGFGFNIFEAHLSCADNCDPILLETKDWDFEIEIGPNGRLTKLQ
ncbi:MAG: hypothetical protein JSR61_09420 [Proteobacteria bacterium]|nr:hypothetical protein [Pseudomonadota bacterium]